MSHIEIDYTNWRGERAIRRIKPTGTMMFASSEWHPVQQWLIEAVDTDKNVVREFAMSGIHSWRQVAYSKTDSDRYLAWYRGSSVGVSSETIFEVMTGITVKRHAIPLDPMDFGRCLGLIRLFPEFKNRLHEVSERFPKWKPFIDNWDKMTELYERDYDTGQATELYEFMQPLVKFAYPHLEKNGL